MPTKGSSKSKSKSTSAASKPARSKRGSLAVEEPSDAKALNRDALALLEEDHRAVRALFQEFDQATGDADKRRLAIAICTALKIHARLEEDIFYPAAFAVIEDGDLISEAEVEHASAKDLIAQIQDMDPSQPLYDAKVTVLGEYIDHHVKEEEGEMFPKVRKVSLDLAAIGEELISRKQALLGELDAEAAA